MKKSSYVINSRAKNRATMYLENLIRNRGLVGERANSNISIVQAYLNEFGIEHEMVSSNGHKSLVTKKSDIILNSHVDVVPGRVEQFLPKIISNRMYGRGAADALGCAVSMIVCAQELKMLNKDVDLMIVSDEEAGGIYGTKYVLENIFSRSELNKVKYAIVGEPTESFGFSVREKGILRLRLKVRGKSGHPEHEDIDNAISKAAEIINFVKSSELLKRRDELYDQMLHINPTIIEGGVASNVVPDKVIVEYDIRFAYGIQVNEILAIFDALKNKYDFDYDILRSRSASYVDSNNDYFSIINRIADNPEKIVTNGASDYSYFFEKGIAGVVYGVKGAGWHKKEEFVELDSMYDYIENIINFVLEAK